MTDQLLFKRAKQLINVEIEGKTPQLCERFDAIKAKNAALGRLNSGATLKALHRAACDELGDCSRIIFAAFARAHAAFRPRARVSRADAKTFTRQCIEDLAAQVSLVLDTELRRFANERMIQRAELALKKPTDLMTRNIDVEVDLHFDHLESSVT